jgi:cysteinyl-tRNA synthetase
MRVLYDLIKEANIHISTHKSDIDIRGLESIARWVTKIVGIFGLDANATPPYDGLGWASSASNSNLNAKEIIEPYSAVYRKVTGEVKHLALHSDVLDKLMAVDVNAEFTTLESSGTKDPEALAMPYLRAVSKIRDELRRIAPTSPAKKQILSLSDQIRDTDLTNLGVCLDDRPDDQGALIKFIPKEELLAQKEEKAAKEREKLAQKEAARLAREKEELAKAEKAKVSPVDLFRDERFSAWDEEGMPTKTKDGEEIPKSALKKLRKEWERQKKLHEEWKAKSGV